MFTLVETAYAAEKGITIHLAPEVLGTVFGVPITGTMLTAWLAMIVLISLAAAVKFGMKLMPGRLQLVFEAFIGAVYDYIADTLGSKEHANKFFPIVTTIFLFVLTMNWLGMLPGMDSIGFYKSMAEGTEKVMALVPLFHAPSTDLNLTLGIAIVSFVTVEFAGVTIVGLWRYVGKFINFRSPLGFAIGLMELISELARLIAFSFRLFGNVFAGETLILVVMFLTTPYLAPVPLMAYEIFVGFIQAFIFAILTLYFIKLAIIEPH